MFYVLFFFFGAAIGSFVLLVSKRLNVSNIISSHSKCLSCGERLKFLDLIPIFSYLYLQGKCRYCKSPYGISSLYTEVVFGLIYVLLYHFVLTGNTSLLISFLWLVYYSLLFVTLGVLTLYDFAHKYIPIGFLLFYCFVTFIMLVVRFLNEPTSLVLLSPIVVSLPFLILFLVTKGKGLGFGDVLLFLGVGAFFGIEQGLLVFFLSIWLGALVGIFVYINRRKHGVKDTSIPFVPFIVLSFLFVLFTDLNLFSIAAIFS